jgi:hypothetical protein
MNTSVILPVSAHRQWTNNDKQKLMADYFERLPGICPVCACEVSMMIEHGQAMAILSLRCRGCGNFGKVARHLER